MFERFKNFRNRKPVLFMVIGYVVLWIFCCLVLTELIGKRQFELYTDEYKKKAEYWLQDHLENLQNEMLNEDFKLENEQTFVEMTYYMLPALFSEYTEGKMYVAGEMVAYDSNKEKSKDTDSDDRVKFSVSLENPDKVFMILLNDNTQYFEYYSCPISYFDKVIEETYAIKGKSAPKWRYGLGIGDSWSIYLVDGYVKGEEFRPGKVEVYYTSFNEGPGMYKDSDHKIIDCSEKGVPEGFEPMDLSCYQDTLFNAGIVIPGDGRSWINVSDSELYSMCINRYYGDFAVAGRFRTSQYDLEVKCSEYRFGGTKYQDLNDHSGYVSSKKTIIDSIGGIPIPLSFLSGDVTLSFKANITAPSREKVDMSFACLIEDCLGEYRSEFFKRMFWVYLGAFIFIAILAIHAYRRYYSLQGKNRFHKSLINSMAHDLKTPLTVVQGFSENLKENVHTEKRDYYAQNILENVSYLNSLIDKNLDFSKKKGFDTAEEETVFLSGMVNNTVSRYGKKLDEKKLTVTRVGETTMKGSPELLSLVIDNLINNAIKYSPENGQIEVVGKYRYFTVQNKAELNYDKNLQNLLAPLEMADESRTAGKGTGLGLSIANGIIQERGGSIKLSYDKKTKIFTCKVIVRKLFGVL